MKRLLLVGAGHAHAEVLKRWAAAPLPDVELVLVSNHENVPYSGMVPGWLAGAYRYDEICIAFGALAQAAGARWIMDELIGLDPDRRNVRLAGGSVLAYDVLSLNVGSTLNPPPPGPNTQVLALRPLSALRSAWESQLDDWARRPPANTLQLTAVGGGAAGVESLLAALARLRAMQPRRAVGARLVTRSTALLPSLAPAAARAAQSALAAAGVAVQLGTDYTARAADRAGPHELLLWAAGAEAHAWQRDGRLAVSPAGFIRVDAQLRSVSHPTVHAAGDCAQWADPLPKSGVYAVRMGPVLSHNLRAALGAGTPVAHVPQRRVLALLNTADGRAIASWGRWSAHGRWVARWKDHIDRAFLRRYNGGNGAVRPSQPPAREQTR
jgi:pyridine nucleotide-disulfide oxidoreductase family protein